MRSRSIKLPDRTQLKGYGTVHSSRRTAVSAALPGTRGSPRTPPAQLTAVWPAPARGGVTPPIYRDFYRAGGDVATGAGAGAGAEAGAALLEALAFALSLAFSFLLSNALARMRSRCV